MKRLIAFLIVGCYVVPATVFNAVILTIALPLRAIMNVFEWAREVSLGGNETYYEVWQDNWNDSMAAYVTDNILHPLE